MNKRVI